MAKPRHRRSEEREDENEEKVEEPGSSEDEGDLHAGRSANGHEGFVEFQNEEAEEGEKAPLSGRRLKRQKEQQRKMKTGTFGELHACVFYAWLHGKESSLL